MGTSTYPSVFEAIDDYVKTKVVSRVVDASFDNEFGIQADSYLELEIPAIPGFKIEHLEYGLCMDSWNGDGLISKVSAWPTWNVALEFRLVALLCPEEDDGWIVYLEAKEV